MGGARVNARIGATAASGAGCGSDVPPAGRPSEAGRPATTREHMLALRWAAGADMCYFLLTQPTCAAEPFSCSETDADLLQPDESGLMADELRFLSGF